MAKEAFSFFFLGLKIACLKSFYEFFLLAVNKVHITVRLSLMDVDSIFYL